VEVIVGGAVFVGNGVCVGVSVGKGGVADGVSAVGVSVTGTFDGRLQPDMAKMKAMIANDKRGFIVSPLFLNHLTGSSYQKQ